MCLGWTMCSKCVNHSRLNSQHYWGGGLHDRFMTLAILTLRNHSSKTGATWEIRKFHKLLLKSHLWIQENFDSEIQVQNHGKQQK
jgi:hypothetical protein